MLSTQRPLEASGARKAPPSPSRGFVSLTRALAALPVAVIVWEGWSRRWVADDAYIDFRVVANLASGHGPVYNRGERVEVYTDPLWVGLLTLFHWIGLLAIQWWAVILGIVFTGCGVWMGGRSGQRLSPAVKGRSPSGSGEHANLVVPLGMLMFVSIDAAWDFATSGLETGMVFGWLGASYAMLAGHAVGQHRSRRAQFSAATVMGLGPLVRPDLLLFSLPFLAALIAVSITGLSSRRSLSRAASILAVSGACPVLYQIWRMTYFAMVVPNTALAKAAGSAWWGQGLVYLRDLVDPYLLWIPLLLAAAVAALRLGQLASNRSYSMMAVVASPLLGALLDGSYVVRVGGDFMHGRMLLPAVFAVGLTFWVPLATSAQIAVAGAACCWSVTAAAFLHYPQRATVINGIANERAWYINQSQNPHPVTPDEYRYGTFGMVGTMLSRAAGSSIPKGESLVLLDGQQGDTASGVLVTTNMAEKVIAPVDNIGIAGLAAGPRVYIYDELSLANPVGSHLRETSKSRPGHSQLAPVVWMDGRFLPASADYFLPTSPPENALTLQPDRAQVEEARKALTCGEMGRYLKAITAPLTLRRMASDFIDSFSYSTFKIDPSPLRAAASCERDG